MKLGQKTYWQWRKSTWIEIIQEKHLLLSLSFHKMKSKQNTCFSLSFSLFFYKMKSSLFGSVIGEASFFFFFNLSNWWQV